MQIEITKPKMCCNVCVKIPQQWQTKLHHYETQTFNDGITLYNFLHYLLGKKNIFYVDHMALVYLICKIQPSWQIVRSLLLFL